MPWGSFEITKQNNLNRSHYVGQSVGGTSMYPLSFCWNLPQQNRQNHEAGNFNRKHWGWWSTRVDQRSRPGGIIPAQRPQWSSKKTTYQGGSRRLPGDNITHTTRLCYQWSASVQTHRRKREGFLHLRRYSFFIEMICPKTNISLSAVFVCHDIGLDKLTGQAPGVLVSSTGGLLSNLLEKQKNPQSGYGLFRYDWNRINSCNSIKIWKNRIGHTKEKGKYRAAMYCFPVLLMSVYLGYHHLQGNYIYTSLER